MRTVAIARVLPRTVAEGPGTRTAIWVQGCSVRCVGCFNPHMWSTIGGKEIAVDELVSIVVDSGSEGVTFLGGEPFDQAGALSQVAAGVRRHDLSVMTFSGFTYEDLLSRSHAGDRGVAALLAGTDLLVDGPFNAALPDYERPWVGSTNQKFRPLTDRYAHVIEHLEKYADQVEITVEADGTTAVNGWASLHALETLLEDLGPRPPSLRIVN